MANRTWRDIVKPIIAEVIARVGLEDTGRLKRELYDAYPFYERAYWPYKVWLDEIKVQTGQKRKDPEVDPRQMNLFKTEITNDKS